MDNHNIEYFENSFVLNKLVNFTEYIQTQDKTVCKAMNF